MRLATGIAFIAGLTVATWLSSLDRAHWLDRYGISLQVEHIRKGDKG